MAGQGGHTCPTNLEVSGPGAPYPGSGCAICAAESRPRFELTDADRASIERTLEEVEAMRAAEEEAGV